MNVLQQRILDPFIAETMSALATLAQLTGSAGTAFVEDPAMFRFKGYAVATNVDGAVPGKVLLHLYPETVKSMGRRVYTSMIGRVLPDTTVEDLREALTEWANCVIGNATRELEAARLDLTFSPPYFISDTHELGPLLDHVVEILTVPIQTEFAGRLYFNYLKHTRSDGG